MKSTLLLTTLIFILGCKKDTNELAEALNRKWQVYSFKVIKMDDSFNQGACIYQTKVSDFYGPPTIAPCQSDDIYDFTDPNKLSIYSGSSKCSPLEPNVTTKNYERRGDSLFVEETSFKIVSLQNDTLILDYCTTMNTYPPGTRVLNKAKLGMKFIAVK